MKKLHNFSFILLIMTILVSCQNSKVDDETAEKYLSKSEHVITLLNEKENDELSQLFDRNLRQHVKEGQFAQLHSLIDQSGRFLEIEHTSVERDKDYYITILATKYTKEHRIFTIKYDRNDDVSDLLVQ